MNFHHVVIVRFNLGLYDSHPDPHGWMAHRMELFERYHLPSIDAQSWSNFSCYYLIDNATPFRAYDKIKRGIGSSDETHHSMERALERAQLSANCLGYDWLVTTRLDNDDAIEPRFIERVQDHLAPRRMLIDTAGVQLDARTGVRWEAPAKVPSPFLTVVEPVEDFKGCYQDQHARMGRHFEHRVFIDELLYTQVLHDHNKANKPSGVKL